MDYQIREGDTLESIAQDKEVPMYQILVQNHLEDSLRLMPGETLKLPGSIGWLKYKVKKGDTLAQIAKDYDTTVSDLQELNGLENVNFLYENEELIIPKKNVSLYFTKEGDTFNQLSKQLNTSNPELLRYNDNIYLYPNQSIFYPKQ